MVDRSHACLKQQDCHDRETLTGGRVRCLNLRLGSTLWRVTNRWLLLINCLEALAAFHAVKCFVREWKSIIVLLRIDNTTAVTNVNKLGGTVSIKLSQGTMALVHEPAFYTLVAEHLPEVLNTNVDQESQVVMERSDWMLNPRIFNKIQQKCMGTTGSGHVCIQTDNSAEKVLQLETRPRSRAAERAEGTWEKAFTHVWSAQKIFN